MIKKERKKSLKIQKLEALLRRLPTSYPKRKSIEDELARRSAGLYGENSLDFHLSFLSDERYHILHDVRLLDHKDRYFQIDSLLISPYFLLILEVKNYSGTLTFDQISNQLIRENNGVVECFPDPFLQVRRQMLQLEWWLQKNKFPQLPIASFIVISNPHTLLKAIPNDPKIFQKVMHAAALPFKVEKLERMYKKEWLNLKEIRKISRLLIKQYIQLDDSVLDQYQISKKELLTGVQCTNCFSLPMQRKRGSWFCPHCKHSSKDAHLSSLHDYALLVGTTITNHQAREFLQIPSISVTSKLLTSLKLQHSGSLRGRKYELSYLDE
ncbi:nuclease-related domain-containing protein [Fictibacillus sp. Mic-4]|uniref:nuclease-related domain-containing protein n=1 Tax=Fictibacillus sp. Mic-4 TaxID=3132826 RepID=UPI003CF10627